MLISKTKRKNIEKIVDKYFNAINFRMSGEQELTAAELKELEEAGIINPHESFKPYAEQSYVIGRVRNLVNGKYTKTDLNKFRVFDAHLFSPLGEKEKFTINHVKESMGIYITKLKETAKASMLTAIGDANEKLAQDALLGTIRSIAEDNIKQRKGVRELARKLREQTLDLNRDWQRAAVTEMSNAFNNGAADAIAARNKGKSSEEVVVYKIVSKDGKLCSKCRSLYLMPDGEPRLFTMAELTANGTNYGLKQSDWKPTIGPMHPRCRCSLAELSRGFDFKEGTQRTTFVGLDKEPVSILKEQRKEKK